MTRLVLFFFFFIFNYLTLLAQKKVEPIVQFGHGTRAVSEMVFSPDGTMLASSDGEFLKLWDMSSGLEFRAFAKETFSFDGISHIDFTPDNNSIIYKSGNEIYINDISNGRVINRIAIGDVQEIELNEDEIPSNEEVEKYITQKQSQGVVFSKDGLLIAEASDQSILIKNYKNKNLISTIEFPKKNEEKGLFTTLMTKSFSAKSFSFSLDKNFLLHKDKLYSVADGQLKFDFNKDKNDFVQTSGAISPNGKNLSSLSRTERATIFWSLSKQKEVYRAKEFFLYKFLDSVIEGVDIALTAKSVKNKFKNLIPSNKDTPSISTTKLDKVRNGAGLINSKGHYNVDFSQDGKKAAIWLDNLYGVTFIDVDKGKKIQTYIDPKLMFMQKAVLSNLDKENEQEHPEEDVEEDSLMANMYPANMNELLMTNFKNQFNLKKLSVISPDFSIWAKATKRINSNKKDPIKITTIVKKKKNRESWDLEESADFQEGLTFSLDGKKIAASSRTNNVFTYGFIQGLRDKKADLNFNEEITISELQQYLSKKVGRLTNNKQLPTFRSENISNDWRIW